MDLLIVILRHIFLLSVPVAVFAVTVRMYRSEKHNQILWAQKSRALQAYQAFVEDTKVLDDRVSREAMLMHVMGLVFSAQDTGYGAPIVQESNVADAIIALKRLSS